MTRVPSPIRTDRLVLRRWEARDAPLLRSAVAASLAELQPWMPWAEAEPSPLDVLEERLARFGRSFDDGTDWFFAVMDPAESEVLGGAGLHPRIGPDALEIGYWIRSDRTRRGLATEAAGALTRVALMEVGAARVEIRCDPRNTASAAVPRRLGFRLREVLHGQVAQTDGTLRDSMVWETTRAELAMAVAAGGPRSSTSS